VARSHELFRGGRTGTKMLLGPSAHVPLTVFPGHARIDALTAHDDAPTRNGRLPRSSRAAAELGL